MLLGLDEWAPKNEKGAAPLIGPGRMPGDRGLEPVRMVGYSPDKRTLMHAKVALCCGVWSWESDFGETKYELEPMGVWLGSANWTKNASQHIEFGAWSTDEHLCRAALKFMTAVIKASEPLSSEALNPDPELAEAEFDDAAMAEYLDL